MISRREFISRMAMETAATTLPLSIRRALAISATRSTGTIHDVEHVVILMQENRSFDHYFGMLRGVRGFNDPRPLVQPNGKPIWYQPTASIRTGDYKERGLSPEASYVLPFYLNPRLTTEYQAGTNHGWSSGHLAWNGGLYDAWVTQKQDPLTMGYLMRQDLAFHYALADAFTVCDAYFCSVHGDTCPNRIYLWSGTCDPRNFYGRKPNGPGLEERVTANGYTWVTYPERLQTNGISWKVYQGGSGNPGFPTDNYTDNSLEFFANYQIAEGASPLSPLVRRGASSHTLKELARDVHNGSLPQVSWIVAPYDYCEHPSASPTNGAYYISLVLDALTSNPAVWSKTVLFLNYDENDGLFDHVVPPMPPASQTPNRCGMVSDDLRESLEDEFLDLDKYPKEKNPLIPGADLGGMQPIGLGPRVPMIVVSPWTTGGWVCSQIFDHTSVLQFLEKRFGVIEPQISRWRRSVCGDLTSAFDFTASHFVSARFLSVPKRIASRHEPYRVPSIQKMPLQEVGVRPARALPYIVSLGCRIENDRIWIDLINDGAAGAAFYIYDMLALRSEPRRYTVSASKQVSDFWSRKQDSPEYDLLIYGPNGYFAHCCGSMQSNLSAKFVPRAGGKYKDLPSVIQIIIQNFEMTPCAFIVHEGYEDVTIHADSTVGVAPLTVEVPISSSDGWFDIRVQIEGNSSFLHRVAGHLEDGEPSKSDPGPRIKTL